MTPLKVKIIIALELADNVVRDTDVITVNPSYLCYAMSVNTASSDIQSPSYSLPSIYCESLLEAECPHRECHGPCVAGIRWGTTMEAFS